MPVQVELIQLSLFNLDKNKLLMIKKHKNCLLFI